MNAALFSQLQAFLAVARARSFSGAGRELGVSRSAISQSVRQLEEHLHVVLLARTTRSVSLTEAGEELLLHLNPVLEGVDNAIDAVNAYRDTPGGTIRLTVHPLAGATVLAPLVARFTAAYPAIELEVSVDLACRDLVGGHFDAGIHLGSSIAQDMIAVPIGGKLRVLTVASPEYLASQALCPIPRDCGSQLPGGRHAEPRRGATVRQDEYRHEPAMAARPFGRFMVVRRNRDQAGCCPSVSSGTRRARQVMDQDRTSPGSSH